MANFGDNRAKSGYRAAAHSFRDGVARVCRLYGVSPLLGDLFAILFLSTEALSLEELCRVSGAAKSTVSVALRRLLSLRMVRRLPTRGDRRDFYEAVEDPWSIFDDWARLFVRPEIEMWRETGAALARALADAPDAPPDDRKREIQARLEQMQAFVDLFEQLLGNLSGARPSRPAARTISIEVDEDSQ